MVASVWINKQELLFEGKVVHECVATNTTVQRQDNVAYARMRVANKIMGFPNRNQIYMKTVASSSSQWGYLTHFLQQIIATEDKLRTIIILQFLMFKCSNIQWPL